MSKPHYLVLGGGGFIGGHLVNRLLQQDCWVSVADLKYPFAECKISRDDCFRGELTDPDFVDRIFTHAVGGGNYDAVYQLAADMGGAGYIFTGEHDANLMTNSAAINLNVAKACIKYRVPKVFYSSSACMYPAHIQTETANPGLKESDAYPAAPDSEYGWEKLFSERLWLAYARNYGLDVRIARFHNVYGEHGAIDDGREKAPAAICRKVAMAKDGGEIEVWGDGQQTRSFLYIDDCIDGIEALMRSDCREPVNIGSDRMISINELARLAMVAADKYLSIKHIDGPLGVRGRNSDNTFCKEAIGWEPKISVYEGIQRTYKWIERQVTK